MTDVDRPGPAALAELYQRHHDRLVSWFRRRLPEHVAAEDLAADVFVRAFDGLARGAQPRETADQWLWGIAHHMLSEHYRSSRRSTLPIDDLQSAAAVAVAEPSPLGKREAFDALYAVAGGLPATGRRVLEGYLDLSLRDMAEVKGSRLAEALGWTRQRVDRELHRALKIAMHRIGLLAVARGIRACPQALAAPSLASVAARSGPGLVPEKSEYDALEQHTAGCPQCSITATQARQEQHWAAGAGLVLLAVNDEPDEQERRRAIIGWWSGQRSVSAPATLTAAIAQPQAAALGGGMPVSLRLASTLRAVTTLAHTAQNNPAMARLGAVAGVIIIALASALLGADSPPIAAARPPSIEPAPPTGSVMAVPIPSAIPSPALTQPTEGPTAGPSVSRQPSRRPTGSPSSTPSQARERCARSPVPIGPSTGGSLLSAVTTHGSDVAWAVGSTGSGVDTRALAMHRTGQQWNAVATPDVENWSQLHGVTATGPAQAWAVGVAGPATGRPTHTLILHWDGGQWAHQSSPSPGSQLNNLFGVWTSGGATGWAVGNHTSTYAQPLVVRWDGAAWTQEALPAIPATSTLVGISGTGDSDVWAVGHRGATGSVRPLILHFDGTTWAQTPAPELNGDAYLLAVKARTAGDAWAVGNTRDSAGRDRPLILRWDGGQWLQFPYAPVDFGVLYDVGPVSATQLWVAGHADGLPLAARWTGESWDSPPGTGQSGLISGTSLDGQGRLLAVGRSTTTPPNAIMESLTC